MELREIRQKKEELEYALFKMLNAFEQETEVTVSRVDFCHLTQRSLGLADSDIPSYVKLEIKL